MLQNVGEHLWPSAEVLGNYILAHASDFSGKHILELGAGATAVPSLAALYVGAKSVIVTDREDAEGKVLRKLQEKNVAENAASHRLDRKRVKFLHLDWRRKSSAAELTSTIRSPVDVILGSDVFFDPTVFLPLLDTVATLLQVFPGAQFIFAFHNRNSDWTVALDIQQRGLTCSLLADCEYQSSQIIVAKIISKPCSASMSSSVVPSVVDAGSGDGGGSQLQPAKKKIIFAGIEGGATCFSFVIMDEDGNKLTSGTGDGLNLLLEGIEAASAKIANTLKEAATVASIDLPVASLGLGLSGADDEGVNEKMIEYFKAHHADVASDVHLTTDAIISIAATFDHGGVVIIAGTGSSCRLLKEDGNVFGSGGWGHLISDEGSAYWISHRAIKLIFDVDDGLTTETPEDIQVLRVTTLDHFGVSCKQSLLNILYGSKSPKSTIASLCEKLAAVADKTGDPIVNKLFYDAGSVLGKHLVAVSKYFDPEMFTNVPVLAIGSVFKSWHLLRQGFEDGIKVERCIHKVSFYELIESPSVGAALLGAKICLGYAPPTSVSALPNNGVEPPKRSILKFHIINRH